MIRVGTIGYKVTEREFVEEYPLDFGSGVRGSWHSYDGRSHAGLIIAHLHEDGVLCAGAVSITYKNNRGAQWTMISEDPLTLAPSILDNSCGLHGHIVDGKWVSC